MGQGAGGRAEVSIAQTRGITKMMMGFVRSERFSALGIASAYDQRSLLAMTDGFRL